MTFEVKSSALGNKAASRAMENQGPNDTQDEVKSLIKKLSFWKEESQRELSDIISGCTYKISEGIKDLVEEVSHLKTRLSLKTKECDDLLGTVDKLNGEIRQMQMGDIRFIAKSPSKRKGKHIWNTSTNDAQEAEMEDSDVLEIEQPRDIARGDLADEGDIEEHQVPQRQSILMDPWNDQQQHSSGNTLNGDIDDPGSNDEQGVRAGMKPIHQTKEERKRWNQEQRAKAGNKRRSNPGEKEAMTYYQAKTNNQYEDVTFTEAKREMEQSYSDFMKSEKCKSMQAKAGMKPIPNTGIKEAMEEYLAKNYSENQDITFTEAKRQKERNFMKS